LIKIW